jgi:hypothetical protein
MDILIRNKMLLQKAPKDAGKLEKLLKVKERQDEESMHITHKKVSYPN